MDVAPPEFCFLTIQHWSTCMTKAEWAGWAQATGAGAALAVALYVVRWQLRHSDRKEIRAKVDRIFHVFGLVTETLRLTERIGAVAEGSLAQFVAYEPSRDKHTLSTLRTSFAALDLKDFALARQPLSEIGADLDALQQVLYAMDNATADSQAMGDAPSLDDIKAAYVFGGGYVAIGRLKSCLEAIEKDAARQGEALEQ